MLVVSDTSPLNYLVLIGHDGVLASLFGRVLTVPSVVAELGHTRSPERVRAWAAAPPSWLEIRSPRLVNPSLRLGPGEAEAISLASEVNADAVLIDERRGAQAAAGLGLLVTGTLGVVQLAHEKGLLRLPDAIAALRGTSFRASEGLLAEMLRRSASPPPR
ncbi:MAG: DUF3368 domain-containing protein [Phycisphaerales bacterium]